MRAAVLVYSAGASVAALSSAFCLVLFLAGGLDRGDPSPAGTALPLNLLLLAVFGIQHSVMARPFWKRLVPEPLARATYLWATAAALFALFYWWRPLPSPVWNVPLSARAVVFVLQLSGLALLAWSVVAIDALDLIGVRQLAGLLARRVVSYVGSDQQRSRGDRLGVIKFGSRVDLFVPESYRILVAVGDRVRNGETAMAEPGSGS